jgi:hypothetical protein
MRDLAEGVDAGVGAAGAADHHRLAGERQRGLLDRLLDGPPVLLPLPTDKRAAIIFDGELVARHADQSSVKANA